MKAICDKCKKRIKSELFIVEDKEICEKCKYKETK